MLHDAIVRWRSPGGMNDRFEKKIFFFTWERAFTCAATWRPSLEAGRGGKLKKKKGNWGQATEGGRDGQGVQRWGKAHLFCRAQDGDSPPLCIRWTSGTRFFIIYWRSSLLLAIRQSCWLGVNIFYPTMTAPIAALTSCSLSLCTFCICSHFFSSSSSFPFLFLRNLLEKKIVMTRASARAAFLILSQSSRLFVCYFWVAVVCDMFGMRFKKNRLSSLSRSIHHCSRQSLKANAYHYCVSWNLFISLINLSRRKKTAGTYNRWQQIFKPFFLCCRASSCSFSR